MSNKKRSKEENKEFLRWMSIFVVVLVVFIVIFLFIMYLRTPANVLPHTEISLENTTIVGKVIKSFLN